MTSNFQLETGRDVGESLRHPAIGLDATDRDTDIVAFVQAANRAKQHDAHVLVATDASDIRLRTELRSLDVTLVELSDSEQDDAQQALCAAGKELGFPGVLLQPTPDTEVAYAESREAFLHTDKYAMQARLTAAHTDADLIAGLPARAASADVVREVRDHVDAVLVVGDTKRATQPLIAEQDGVSVVVSDANTDTAAIQVLFEYVERNYSDYDAFVLCDEGGEHDPGWIPDLTDALTTENADLVVGQSKDADAAGSESAYRRLKGRLQDSFTLGTAETAAASLHPGLQALSPTAVSRLDVPADASEIGPQLLETAISSDLSVSVTDVAPDEDAAADADAAADIVADTDTTPQLNPEHSPTLDLDAGSSQPLSSTTETGPPHRAKRSEDSDNTGEAVKSPEEFIVGAESDVTPVLSVVIPTMNEEKGIGTCLDWVHDAVAELRVPTEIIVSDSSTDRTPDIAREKGAIVVEPDEPGYGYAYRYAFGRVRGEYVVMGDADTTYDFSEIPRLLDHLHETDADIVMGSRLEGEIKPGSMPALHKYVGNPLLTRFLNAFYDAGVSDAHSGFRVLTHDAVEALDVGSDGMEFASEMVMDASVRGLTIEEVPITYHERVGEETLDSFRDGWRHVRFMLVNAPGNLFSVPAVVLFGLGLLMLALSAAGVSFGGLTFSVHTTIAGSLLTIIGYQIGTLGVFSTIAADPIKKPTDRLSDWVVDSVRLEHGLAFGGAVFFAGSGYAAVMTGRWLATGQLPLVVPNMLAFTAIVLGLQTAFSSFYLSILATTQDHASGHETQ